MTTCWTNLENYRPSSLTRLLGPLLKREQNDVAGLDILLHDLGGSITTVGDKLILLKTELPE